MPGRRLVPLAVVFGLLLTVLGVTGSRPARAAEVPVTISAPATPVYRVLELTFSLPTSYDPAVPARNPFDPTVVDVRAEITLPTGAIERATGFWYQPVSERTHATDDYVAAPVSAGVWKVRYAPRVVGAHSFRIDVTAAGVTTPMATGGFMATPPTSRGFVRRDAVQPTRLVFDDGTPFVPIGSNLAWDRKLTFAQVFASYQANRLNFGRVWLVMPSESHFLLEWGAGVTKQLDSIDTVTYGGLGRYQQENAYKLDKLLEAAQAHDIALMLSLWTHHAFITHYTYKVEWLDRNPYYRQLGVTGRTFWTNDAARRHFRNYVRYIGARYGAYSSLGMVEFWNELDGADVSPYSFGGGVSAMTVWHQEMVNALHAASPSRLLTTTSFAAMSKWWRDQALYPTYGALPMLDVTQTHHYDSGPYSAYMPCDFGKQSRWANATWGRPHLYGEYGWREHDFYRYPMPPAGSANNPQLLHLHHYGTWAPVMHGGAAGANLYWRVDYSFVLPADFQRTARLFATWLEPDLPYLRTMHHVYDGPPLADCPFEPPGLAIGGYRSATRAALYIADRQAARWTEPDANLTPVTGAHYVVTGLADGRYTVAFTDPWTGTVLGQLPDQAPVGGSLTLTLPPFLRDLAVRVFDPAEAPPDPLTLPTATPTVPATATAPAPPTHSPSPTVPPTATITPTRDPSIPTATATATRTPTPVGGLPPPICQVSLSPCSVSVATSPDPSKANPVGAPLVIDGKGWTRWETAWSTPATASLTIDVGTARPLNLARWLTGTKQAAVRFHVESSSDGQTWERLSPEPGLAVVNSNSWEELPVGRTARYVRWTFINVAPLQGKLGGFAEVQLYGP